MKRFAFNQQIGGVGLFAAVISVLVPAYFINRGFSNEIGFATLEPAGIEYQRPLLDLMDGLCRHQAQVPAEAAGDGETRRHLAKRKREHCRWDTVKGE